MRFILAIFFTVSIFLSSHTIILATNNSTYYLNKGDKFNDIGKVEDALEMYLQALYHSSSRTDKIRVYASLTAIHYKKEDYRNSKIYCNKLLTIAPKSKWGENWFKKIDVKLNYNETYSKEHSIDNKAFNVNFNNGQSTRDAELNCVRILYLDVKSWAKIQEERRSLTGFNPATATPMEQAQPPVSG